MLTEISIKNFAIIDDLTIQFSDGLTILSGETGAGKSIVINAINLILGSRATSKMIRTGADTAEVEALFHIHKKSPAFESLIMHGFDPSEDLLIKRVISRSDRHRVYINGQLSTMQLLTKVSENLAAISGQHEHQRLLNEIQHLVILDHFGDITPLRTKMQKCFHEIIPLVQELEELKVSQNKQNDHIELLEFQKKEIEDADISLNEDDTLNQEQIRLKNAEMLHQTVYNSVEVLYSGEGAVTEIVGKIKKKIENASRIDATLVSSADGLNDATFRIEDIARNLQSYIDGISFDAHRLDEIETRLDQINRLKRKYGGSIEAIFDYCEKISQEIKDHENLDENIAAIEIKLEEKHGQLVQLSEKLTASRKKFAVKLSQKVEKELNDLKMPKTKFEIEFSKTPTTEKASPYLSAGGFMLSETGVEQSRFLIAPNIGETLKPLSKIASGGELSRVILALKSIKANDALTDTIVFDEVDAGIGGEVAETVGKKLSALAENNQVICITHLAQIAAFGHHHYKISKHVEKGRTYTRIFPVKGKHRLEETARMISGEKITPTTRTHAREMLKDGRNYRPSSAT